VRADSQRVSAASLASKNVCDDTNERCATEIVSVDDLIHIDRAVAAASETAPKLKLQASAKSDAVVIVCRNREDRLMRFLTVAFVVGLCGCGFPMPADVGPDDGGEPPMADDGGEPIMPGQVCSPG
jgi:hypothetical protein